MSIIPEGEQLRKAVKWISEEKSENPGKPLYKFIEQACMKFDLSPKDSEFLMNFFLEKGAEAKG